MKPLLWYELGRFYSGREIMRKIFTGLELLVLSMGMSGDFEAAIMQESGRFYFARKIENLCVKFHKPLNIVIYL